MRDDPGSRQLTPARLATCTGDGSDHSDVSRESPGRVTLRSREPHHRESANADLRLHIPSGAFAVGSVSSARPSCWLPPVSRAGHDPIRNADEKIGPCVASSFATSALFVLKYMHRACHRSTSPKRLITRLKSAMAKSPQGKRFPPEGKKGSRDANVFPKHICVFIGAGISPLVLGSVTRF